MVVRQDRQTRSWELLALAGAIALAAAFRIWRMGEWSFEADEVYTLRDSVTLRPTNPRPLMYLLNHYLVLPFTGPDEVSLRLLPVVFGIVGIPVLYFMVRRIDSGRAGLFAALLLALSPLHIARSQYARYWTLMFVLTTIYPLAIYIAVHERRGRWLAVGLVAGVLATLAHTTASLLFGGVLLWLAITGWRDPKIRATLSRPAVRLTLAGIAIAGVAAVALKLMPLLAGRVALPQRSLGGPALLMSYVDGLTAALVVTGIAGLGWLWLEGARSLAVLLAGVAIVPAVFLFFVSMYAPVPTAYLFATAPVFFIGGGIFLDRLAALPVARPVRRLLLGGYSLLLLTAVAPLLISNYRDGGRPDLRTVATHLRAEVRPGDAIVADEFPVLRHYLPGQAVDTLKRDPRDLAEEATRVQAAHPDGALWVVALTSKRGGFNRNKFGLGSTAEWLYANCQLRSAVGVPRLDYRQNEVQTFRCSIAPGGGQRALDPASNSP